MKPVKSGGGWPALRYAWRLARRVGGVRKLYAALATRNACKTCALGMGGMAGGMVDESGRFPEVCKKSMQAMAADMQGRITSEFWKRYSLDELRAMSPRELEHMGRLAEPVIASPGDTRYRPISWDAAMAFCAERLKAVAPDETFFYASGRSSNEAGFLLQLFARLYGTNNVNNCSYYCHQASGVGLSSALGTGTATIQLEDLKHCDLVFLIGGNPASNHPRLMRTLMELRRRGGQVIVVNPMIETGLVNFSVPSDVRSLFFGSEIASLYVQPHIGGDIAFLTAVSKLIAENDPRRHRDGSPLDFFLEDPDSDILLDSRNWPGLDAYFLLRHSEGGDEYLRFLSECPLDLLIELSGVPEKVIRQVVDLYGQSKATVFAWTMGITHHVHGTDNVRAIINLALLRGMVGKPGAGLLPIRGHSNVQGIGSVGVAPKLREAVFERLQSHFGVHLPTSPGMDTLACMESMHAGRVKNAFCLGGNLFGSNPDARWTTEAFARLESCVYISTTLNTGHAWGRGQSTLILPCLARDEEPQATTQESMFNFVRLSEGGPARFEGPRSEVQIIADLGAAVLGDRTPVDWRALAEHRNIRAALAAIVPGYEEIGRIDDTRREFQIAGRTFRHPSFNTRSGKARFHVVPIPQPDVGDDSSRDGTESGGDSPWLRLMTIRSEGQFNTVVYEEDDLYRGQECRDVILMNEADIVRLNLQVDQRVTVRSAVGAMPNILVRDASIRAGNAAMYCPEANVLVPRAADPESRTPAFKSVRVTLHADPGGAFVPLGLPRGAVDRAPVGQRLHSC